MRPSSSPSQALASTSAVTPRSSFRCRATPSSTARLFFSVPKRVAYGHSVGLVGSSESAGGWNPEHALQLTWHNNDSWSGELEVPVGQQIEYKFFTRNAAGSVEEWQPGNNLILDVPEDANAVLLVTDDWQGKDRIVSIHSREEVEKMPLTPDNIPEIASISESRNSPELEQVEEQVQPKEQPRGPPEFLQFEQQQQQQPEMASEEQRSDTKGPSSLQYGAGVQSAPLSNGSEAEPEAEPEPEPLPKSSESSKDEAELEVPTEEELDTLKVKELKALLKERELPVTGRKADLIKRLQEGWSSILDKA